MTAPPAGALEACPFCGGEAELRGTATQRYVGCLTDLCVDGPYGDFDDAAAIAAWNRRTHGPALLAALRLREWRPIAEAPKDETILLHGWNNGNPAHGSHLVIGSNWAGSWVDRGMEQSNRDIGVRLAYITHWMPLPEPPTADDLARVLEEGE